MVLFLTLLVRGTISYNFLPTAFFYVLSIAELFSALCTFTKKKMVEKFATVASLQGGKRHDTELRVCLVR